MWHRNCYAYDILRSRKIIQAKIQAILIFMKHRMIRPKVISQQTVYISNFLEIYNIVTAKKTLQNTSPSTRETEQTLRNHPKAYSITPKKNFCYCKTG